MRIGMVSILLGSLLLLGGCATTQQPPLETVDQVDLERYMGDWYVIAHIPSFLDAEAYNAMESYHLGRDGRIYITYTFLDGGFEGEMEILQPVGTVINTDTNAEWGMQYLWPIQAQYLITWLDEGYNTAIVSRDKRDYVWIMARTPKIEPERYEQLVKIVKQQGYDISELRKVPQRWPAE